MQSFVWFWLKQWIRLRYSSVPSIRPDRLQKILAMQQAGDWLVLDARTTAEFNVSCLPGAVPIGDGEEISLSGPLGNAPRERPILVCCAVGVRSAAVVKRLRERGFRKAVNLEGGLFEWVNQGHQLVHEGQPTGTYQESCLLGVLSCAPTRSLLRVDVHGPRDPGIVVIS